MFECSTPLRRLILGIALVARFSQGLQLLVGEHASLKGLSTSPGLLHFFYCLGFLKLLCFPCHVGFPRLLTFPKLLSISSPCTSPSGDFSLGIWWDYRQYSTALCDQNIAYYNCTWCTLHTWLWNFLDNGRNNRPKLMIFNCSCTITRCVQPMTIEFHFGSPQFIATRASILWLLLTHGCFGCFFEIHVNFNNLVSPLL